MTRHTEKPLKDMPKDELVKYAEGLRHRKTRALTNRTSAVKALKKEREEKAALQKEFEELKEKHLKFLGLKPFVPSESLDKMKKDELFEYATFLEEGRHYTAQREILAWDICDRLLKELKELKAAQTCAPTVEKLHIGVEGHETDGNDAGQVFKTARAKELEKIPKGDLVRLVLTAEKQRDYIRKIARDRGVLLLEASEEIDELKAKLGATEGCKNDPGDPCEEPIASPEWYKKVDHPEKMLKVELVEAVKGLEEHREFLRGVAENRLHLRDKALKTVEALRVELHDALQKLHASMEARKKDAEVHVEGVDKLLRTVAALESAFKKVEAAYHKMEAKAFSSEERLDKLRGALFHPALILALHRFLDQEESLSKKASIKNLLSDIGDHMVAAVKDDPEIWKSMAAAIY